MASIPYPSLYPHTLACDFAAFSIKQWNLVLHLLNLGWSHELLWLIKCNRRNGVRIPGLGLKRLASLLSLLEPQDSHVNKPV